MRPALRVSSSNEHSDEGSEFALVEVTPGLAALGNESFFEYAVIRPELMPNAEITSLQATCRYQSAAGLIASGLPKSR